MSTVMSAAEDTPLERVKRTILQKFDVADGKYETVIELMELGPNAAMDRHSHSGPEAGYLLDGEMTIECDGQPVQRVKPGQSYLLPADVVHAVRWGPAGSKGVYMWVVEKDKPFRSWSDQRA